MADVEIRLDEGAIRSLTSSRELLDGMRVAAQIVEAEAKRRVPVRTGNLRRSIYHEVEQEGKSWTARVGTNVKYGIFQELGTRFHSPQPYLRPALEHLRRRLRLL